MACVEEIGLSKNWKLILNSIEIQNRVKKCAEVLNNKFAGQKVVVVGILKGAVYFFVDLTRMLTIPHSCYFIEATSYHDKQTQSEQVGIMGSIEPSKFVGRQVILIDELFDNGKTLYEIKSAVINKANVPAERIYTCTLFKKNKTTKYPDPDLYGSTVPNVWLVGYGLDDSQEKRNWINLYGVPKVEGIAETADDIIFKDDLAYEKMRQIILKDNLAYIKMHHIISEDNLAYEKMYQEFN